jgi:hypothetical protein
MRRPMSFAAGCVLVLCNIHLASQTSADFSHADKYKAVKDVLQEFYENGTVSSGLRFYENGEYDLSAGGTVPRYF